MFSGSQKRRRARVVLTWARGVCLGWAVLWLGAAWGAAMAADTGAQPAMAPAETAASGAERPVAPEVEAVKVDEPPTIDGRVDDACWQAATHVVGFWRMDDGGRRGTGVSLRHLAAEPGSGYTASDDPLAGLVVGAGHAAVMYDLRERMRV